MAIFAIATHKETTMKYRVHLTIWSLIALFVLLLGTPYFVKGLGWLSLIGFTPLLLIEHICSKEKIKHAFWYYVIALLFFNLFTTWWLWCVAPMAMVMANLVNTLAMTGLFALFLLVKHLCRDSINILRSSIPYLFLIAEWLAWERIYQQIEISWPWLTLGNGFATTPRLIQWYENTGVLGGSLWILGCSLLAFALIVCLMSHKKMETAVTGTLLAAAIIIPSTISLLRYYTYEEKGEAVQVALVQPNVDPFMKYGYIPQDTLDNNLLRLFDSVITPKTKYLITPETFTFNIDLMNPMLSPSFQKYVNYLKEHPDMDMLLGALTYHATYSSRKPSKTARRYNFGWLDLYNTAMVFDSTGFIYKDRCYHKSKLVPGVEFIPYLDALSWLGPIFEKFGGSSTSYARLSSMNAIANRGPLKFAPIICYESVYGDYCTGAMRDGANVIAVITNDGWWGNTPGHTQHFNFAAIRAIENRRDVVHVANNGTSGFINQRGDILSETPWWVETAMVGELHPNGKLTKFSTYGDRLGKVAIPSAGILFLVALLVFASGKLFSRGKSAARKS